MRQKFLSEASKLRGKVITNKKSLKKLEEPREAEMCTICMGEIELD
jgi:hypothetical protein